MTHPKGKNLYGIFNDSFPPILDGVTLTVQNYVYWLSRMGRQPCVVTPWNPVRTEVDYDVMRFFSLPIASRRPYRYGYPKLDPFIWRRLLSTDFKLLHSHCPFSSGRLAVYVKRHTGVPLIGTFHSKYREDLKHSFKYLPWCVPIIMKRILNFFNACDHVWIPQAQVEETVREYGYKGKLTVVENGNDFTALADEANLDTYRLNARRRLGCSEDKLQLLFVGQHIWEKGIGMIVDALAILKDSTDFHMHFIGQGYAAHELQQRVEQLGFADRVTMHGVLQGREILADHYAASDLFIFPSMYDNAPLVVREAAAMGTPSILVNGSTASEVISDGHNGFLTGNSAAELAEAIRTLGKDKELRKRVGLEARRTLVRSWENVVEEVAARYDDILANHRRR
ncbi:MAG: glycosyltransferase [Muribaculaceae bacterium]|nr:glycosyltransferase [Muribaculaceae bacterium]